MRCNGIPILLRSFCFVLVIRHAVGIKHWWYHDYAQVSQFHGCWFLYGWSFGNGTNVLFPFIDVSAKIGLDPKVRRERAANLTNALHPIDLLDTLAINTTKVKMVSLGPKRDS